MSLHPEVLVLSTQHTTTTNNRRGSHSTLDSDEDSGAGGSILAGSHNSTTLIPLPSSLSPAPRFRAPQAPPEDSSASSGSADRLSLSPSRSPPQTSLLVPPAAAGGGSLGRKPSFNQHSLDYRHLSLDSDEDTRRLFSTSPHRGSSFKRYDSPTTSSAAKRAPVLGQDLSPIAAAIQTKPRGKPLTAEQHMNKLKAALGTDSTTTPAKRRTVATASGLARATSPTISSRNHINKSPASPSLTTSSRKLRSTTPGGTATEGQNRTARNLRRMAKAEEEAKLAIERESEQRRRKNALKRASQQLAECPVEEVRELLFYTPPPLVAGAEESRKAAAAAAAAGSSQRSPSVSTNRVGKKTSRSSTPSRTWDASQYSYNKIVVFQHDADDDDEDDDEDDAAGGGLDHSPNGGARYRRRTTPSPYRHRYFPPGSCGEGRRHGDVNDGHSPKDAAPPATAADRVDLTTKGVEASTTATTASNNNLRDGGVGAMTSQPQANQGMRAAMAAAYQQQWRTTLPCDGPSPSGGGAVQVKLVPRQTDTLDVSPAVTRRLEDAVKISERTADLERTAARSDTTASLSSQVVAPPAVAAASFNRSSAQITPVRNHQWNSSTLDKTSPRPVMAFATPPPPPDEAQRSSAIDGSTGKGRGHPRDLVDAVAGDMSLLFGAGKKATAKYVARGPLMTPLSLI